MLRLRNVKSPESRTVADCITIKNAFQVFHALIRIFMMSGRVRDLPFGKCGECNQRINFLLCRGRNKTGINFATLLTFSVNMDTLDNQFARGDCCAFQL